jgi:hypothetical protein
MGEAVMTDFFDLFSTNANNAMWALAQQSGGQTSRVIAVRDAMKAKQYIAASIGLPGVHQVSNEEQDFAWVDGVVTCPMTDVGAKFTLEIFWRECSPPFTPQGAIVWLSESPQLSRRYWVTWPVGTPYNPQQVWVEDIT